MIDEHFKFPSNEECVHNRELMANSLCIICQQNPCSYLCSARFSSKGKKRGIAGNMLCEYLKQNCQECDGSKIKCMVHGKTTGLNKCIWTCLPFILCKCWQFTSAF